MSYKEFLQKYVGQKAHFDLSMDGYYLLDFTGASYSNATLREAHDDFVIMYDEVDKYNIVMPYASILIRF